MIGAKYRPTDSQVYCGIVASLSINGTSVAGVPVVVLTSDKLNKQGVETYTNTKGFFGCSCVCVLFFFFLRVSRLVNK